MTTLERGIFSKLFNRGGYILDFTTAEFDIFTMESVGVALCEKYHMSKGRSLNAFIHEADKKQADKLLFDLLKYYENSYGNFERETVPNEFGNIMLDDGVDYSGIYKRCKEIQQAQSSRLDDYAEVLAQNVKEAFSSDYIDVQMQIMMSMQTTNPAEAIGKAKEMIESCCKGIMEENSIAYDKNWDVPRLVDETMKILSITPKHIPDTSLGATSIKAILGNLKAIATHIAEVRNQYGSGHGKSPNFKGMEERHAKLAVGSALTLVNFLWDSHLRKTNKQKTN